MQNSETQVTTKELTAEEALENIKQMVEKTVVTNVEGLRLIDGWFETVKKAVNPTINK